MSKGGGGGGPSESTVVQTNLPEWRVLVMKAPFPTSLIRAKG